MDLSRSETGIRILDEDAELIEIHQHPTEARAWKGVVEVKGENVKTDFSNNVYNIALGTKSCLAQLGIFVTIDHKGKTKMPDIDITKDGITAKIRGTRYSNYPVHVQEGDPIGRFFKKIGGPLGQPEVQELMALCADKKKHIYERGGEESIGEDGGIILTPSGVIFPVDPATKKEKPFRVTSRKHLSDLLRNVPVDPETVELRQGDFVVTETEVIRIPMGLAGVLLVDQLGDMAQPAHLNSPIVDPGFEAPLRLELFQPHPFPVYLKDIFVRMYLFRAEIIKVTQAKSSGNTVADTSQFRKEADARERKMNQGS